MTDAPIDLAIDRDSVCAGDDCQSHAARLSVPPEMPLHEVIELAQRACPLARIAGGQATWLVDTQGCGEACIGVVAQQWATPKLLLDPATLAREIWSSENGARPFVLYFRYWCQADPEAVFEALKSGGELPPRYGG
jgi:hypothetical protein